MHPGGIDKRIEGGQLLAAIGAVVLLVSLFLDWFEPDVNAWKVFEIVDLILAGIAVALIFRAVEHIRHAGSAPVSPEPAPPSAGATREHWPAAAGLLALVLVVATLVNHPPAAIGLETKVGIWIALAGAALLAAGTLIDRAGISFSFTVSRPASDASGEPPSAAPAEPRPAESPEGTEAETRPMPKS